MSDESKRIERRHRLKRSGTTVTREVLGVSYNEFEIIRDKLMRYNPFDLMSAQYSKNLRMALFQFWDNPFIPKSLFDLLKESKEGDKT